MNLFPSGFGACYVLHAEMVPILVLTQLKCVHWTFADDIPRWHARGAGFSIELVLDSVNM